MRITAKKYENGDRFAVETTPDGHSIIRILDGQREVGKRIVAYVEVIADDNEEGREQLLDALHWLTTNVSKRKIRHGNKKRSTGNGLSATTAKEK